MHFVVRCLVETPAFGQGALEDLRQCRKPLKDASRDDPSALDDALAALRVGKG